ncbi:MAG: hypothetical protein WCP21_10570 [Armatimonadota bacterium]
MNSDVLERSSTRSTTVSTLALSTAVCLLVVVLFCWASPACWHWFIIPVLLCGIIITRDALDWGLGRVDLMSPVGIIGVLGVHFLFLAPLLHVYLDYWAFDGAPPPDWRQWLGWMAIFNFMGLVVYACYLKYAERADKTRIRKTPVVVWRLAGERGKIVLGVALVVAVAVQLYTYAKSGGIVGYMMDFTLKNDVFAGTGWLAMISECAPILLLMGFAIKAKERQSWRSWSVLLAVLLGFLILRLLFGGLKGNRSHTVYGLIWAVGIVHLCIRAVPKKLIWAGVVLGICFMYLYGFYKVLGAGVFTLAEGTSITSLQEGVPSRDLQGVILGDLAHSSVQAYLLYRLWTVRDFQYAYGRTYWGAVCQVIPRAWWPERPPTEEMWTTELERGRGMHMAASETGSGRYRWMTSHVLGLAGETILNFGPLPIPLAFLLWAIVVGMVRGLESIWGIEDARRLLLPLLMTICVKLLVADTGNVVWYALKEGLVPVLVIYFGSLPAVARGKTARAEDPLLPA